MASSSSSLSQNWDHDVFPSFHGQDVRQNFLSHMLKEFRNKGIDTFIDNNIERGESIGPELKRAIRGSKIAIVLLSEKYTSSSWCLDELVEIMNKESDQMVMTIFYKVNPTDVKKQTGNLGKVFQETCQGKDKEKTETWRQALEGVATIAGYHITNMDNEVAMIEEIAAHISNKLNIATLSGNFDRFVGMGDHMERLEALLRLDLDEVRMIGIWGPPGIGKSTIARVLFNQVSSSFQLRAIMVNIKGSYPRPCLDEGSAQLQLQKQMLSQMLNHKDLVINHLGVAQERLKGKKVFLVLDDVDKIAQLAALAGKIHWFGLGSRIVITTEDQRLLKAHGIKDIYKVDYPTTDEALQMFCMYAFDQKYPKDGFTNLAWEVTELAGELPLGLKVMGSYFRGMSKDEWTKTLPRLRTRLDSDIGSVLKFSYDALDDDDKDLFLHIACFFNHTEIEEVAEYLEKRFPDVRQRLVVLCEKSLISMEKGLVIMHSLLVQLGRDIDRKKLGQRQFLEDIHEEELMDDVAGRRSVIGIVIEMWCEDKLNINERAFEGMSNLQFLSIEARLSQGPIYLSPKIRLLDWDYFPMTCLPSSVNVEFLVKLNMLHSKLEKLWEGNKSLRNLKRMSLSYSKNLKEIPNLSTAISLKELRLDGCSNLVKLPFSIGSATNLQKLDLRCCSSLVELPSSIGKATNLQELNLRGCSSLVELPSSIEKATNLQRLDLKNCSSLMKLPSSIGNLINLQYLDLRCCSSLGEVPFSIGNVIAITQSSSEPQTPSSIGNAVDLTGLNFSGCSSLVKVPASIGYLKSVDSLDLSGCSSLNSFPEISTNTRSLVLSGTAIEEVPSSITRCYCLRQLILKGCQKLVSLPQLPESLLDLNVENCESLERLDCSFSKFYMKLNFANCFKLDKDARDLIIQSSSSHAHVLPGKEIPICFTHQANGGSLLLNFNQRHFPSFLKIKACILLGCMNDTEVGDDENDVEYSDDEEYGHEEKYRDICADKYVGRKVSIYLGIKDKHNRVVMRTHKITDLCSPLTEHLYICKHFFYFEEDVTSHELFFEFSVSGNKWVIKACGVSNEANEEIPEDNSDCEGKEETNEADVTSSGIFFELLTNDCGMNYGDCEAKEETNEADVTLPGRFFEFLTKDCRVNCGDCETGEETNEGDCAETKKRVMDQDGDTSLVIGTSSKYTSHPGVGCSKPMAIEMGFNGGKVFKAIHEQAKAFLSSELSDVPSEVGINGDCKAEENPKVNDSAEIKKRKKQSPFIVVDKNSTSEVGSNGNCEAEEEVNGNDFARTKKSRLSL